MLSKHNMGAVVDPTKWYRFVQPFIFGKEAKIGFFAVISILLASGFLIAGPVVWVEAGLWMLGAAFICSLIAILLVWAVALSSVYHDDDDRYKRHSGLIRLINTYNSMPRAKRREFKQFMRDAYIEAEPGVLYKEELELFFHYAETPKSRNINDALTKVRKEREMAKEQARLQKAIEDQAWSVVDEINRGVKPHV